MKYTNLCRFSSTTFELASRELVKELRRIVGGEFDQALGQFGTSILSVEEAKLLLEALFYDEDKREYKGPLLRELCAGGALDCCDLCSFRSLQENLQGWEKRHERYSLVFRAIKLIPCFFTCENGMEYSLRKAALYGISEVERGFAYLEQLKVISSCLSTDPISPTTCTWTDGTSNRDTRTRLLELVRLSHSGDRAIVDYRRPANRPRRQSVQDTDQQDCSVDQSPSDYFCKTAWAQDPAHQCDDDTIDEWLENCTELTACVGGFERSLPEIDEMVTSLSCHLSFFYLPRFPVSGSQHVDLICLTAAFKCSQTTLDSFPRSF